jgi:hypothetical protein
MSKSPFDALVRAAVIALVAGLLIFTWGLTGFGKLFGGGVPEWFTSGFGGTFLASFPGLTISFYSIALLESLAAIIALATFLRLEFLPHRRPIALQTALLLSLLIFVQLGFGKRLVADHDGAHDLFMYAAAALVMLLAVRRLDETSGEARP